MKDSFIVIFKTFTDTDTEAYTDTHPKLLLCPSGFRE